MSKIFTTIILLWVIASCSTSSPVTGNPSDATSSPGTIGSSKMTTEMPRRPQVDEGRQSDSVLRRRDSLLQARPL